MSTNIGDSLSHSETERRMLSEPNLALALWLQHLMGITFLQGVAGVVEFVLLRKLGWSFCAENQHYIHNLSEELYTE